MIKDIILERLKLENFKNYENEEFLFHEGFNVIVGNNGMGKTNALDAIYFCSLLKSKFVSSDQALIRSGAEYLRIEADWLIENQKNTLELAWRGKQKLYKFDGIVIEKKSTWLGTLPVFFICPEDMELIRDGSAIRRSNVDYLLCLLSKDYLMNLVNYNRLLSQRNTYLKTTPSSQINSRFLLTYSTQMNEIGQEIYQYRKAFSEQLTPIFSDFLDKITLNQDPSSYQYKSELAHETLFNLHERSIEKDVLLKRTSHGLHKDDWQFMMNDKKIKFFGSQGQKKSFVIAFKLALAQFFRKNSSTNPIIMIDDMLDKLDSDRVGRLLQDLCKRSFKQVFITNTNTSIFHQDNINDVPMKLIHVKNGHIV